MKRILTTHCGTSLTHDNPERTGRCSASGSREDDRYSLRSATRSGDSGDHRLRRS